MAGIAGLFPNAVPRGKVAIASAEIFIFLVLLMNGPAGAALAAAAEAAVATWRASTRWTSRIFSPSTAALAMFSCGTMFSFAWEWIKQQVGIPSFATTVLLLFPLAVTYYAAQTLLMSSLITLKQPNHCVL